MKEYIKIELIVDGHSQGESVVEVEEVAVDLGDMPEGSYYKLTRVASPDEEKI